MRSPLPLAVLVVVSASVSVAAEESLVLRYRGSLADAGRGTTRQPTKRFDLLCIVDRPDKQHATVHYVVEETPPVALPWPVRFGTLRIDSEAGRLDGPPMRVLLRHETSQRAVVIRPPVFEFQTQLRPGGKWTSGKQGYVVADKEKVSDRTCWKVEVTTVFGRFRTVWVDANDGLVVRLRERVFISGGVPYSLELDLDSTRSLDEAARRQLDAPLATLASIQSALERDVDDLKPELSREQLAAVHDLAERLLQQANKTLLEDLAADIRRDILVQTNRARSLDELAQKTVGKPAPEFELPLLDGQSIASKNLAGRVVVLHFWEYRHEPLEEPYGQVGYLDFLNQNNSRRKLDVAVLGIAVDRGLADPNEAPAIRRSVRKLKEFMNLSFPIALDSGTTIRKFGDPRVLEGRLPLWIVIGADGRIVHYKAGHYQVDPNKGLTELQSIVFAEVRKQRRRPSN